MIKYVYNLQGLEQNTLLNTALKGKSKAIAKVKVKQLPR